MNKYDLFNQIVLNNGNVRLSPISSKEEAEEIIFLAHQLEHEGKISLVEFCMEKDPIAVSLKTNYK
ncbi:hypothetical protein [Neobacillus cucumis]|uniref:hypothetical protein n=1 Tax=Neobacillus cucumis TaxID=1740721 RepID=UPI0019628453|nr:hypothetical protein [Neobacillus cucumis]MBM7655270.1 hypothetical protein [Neobacillus cucumis]MDR4947172.1 hypothetical protein [Neobacillus cucumis]MED4229558.1 hypothetical protein [Neobacillus cucumis]